MNLSSSNINPSIFQIAVNDIFNHVVITDLDGKIVFANPSAERITGYSKEEMIGQTPRLWGRQMPSEYYLNLWDTIKNKRQVFKGELINKRKNGEIYNARVVITPLIDSNGTLIGFLSTEEDVTLAKAAGSSTSDFLTHTAKEVETPITLNTKDLEEIKNEAYQNLSDVNKKRLDNVIETNKGLVYKVKSLIDLANSDVFKLAVLSSFNHIVITDLDGKIIFANPSVTRITGYTQQEVLGKNPSLWGGQMPKEFYQEMWHIIKEKKEVFKGELVNKRKNGELYTARSVISPIFDSKKDLIGFIGTEEDITLAKKSDQMKTDFVSVTAHQLKTPMTSISWNLELIKDEVYDKLSSEGKVTMDTVIASNKSLIAYVDSLLNITRMEFGRLYVSTKDIELNNLIKDVISDAAQSYKIDVSRIQFNKSDYLNLHIDPSLIRLILTNLITNAIKYSPENAPIIVDYTKDDKNIIISVKDSGFGIPKDQQDKVFSKNFRAKNVADKKINGTGLGLYVVKLIVNTYHGRMWFESEENKGSTFYFTIPLEGMADKTGEVELAISPTELV